MPGFVDGLDDLIRRLSAISGGIAPQRFATERGSRYVLLPDGTTLRHKAARPEHPNEFGWMDISDKTAFLTPEQANALSVVQATGPRRMTLVRDTDSPRIAVAYSEGPDALRPFRGTAVSPYDAPDVGLIPLEMLRGKTPHFGNRIVDVAPEPLWDQWLRRYESGMPPP